ncbi:MAG: hypothetical protein QM493_07045 [Sulfurovum sp.]
MKFNEKLVYISSVGLLLVWFISQTILPRGIIYNSFLSQIVSRFSNLNRVEVYLVQDKELIVTILWKGNSNEYKKVFSTKEDIDKKVGYSYGSNTFLVIVNDQEISEFIHLKDNMWYSNIYQFFIKKVDEKSYIIDFKIVGELGSLALSRKSMNSDEDILR